MKTGKARRGDGAVGASELAKMGRCERLVVLESVHGPRRSPSQEEARRSGIAAHARFELLRIPVHAIIESDIRSILPDVREQQHHRRWIDVAALFNGASVREAC